jgi:hypothetical protein
MEVIPLIGAAIDAAVNVGDSSVEKFKVSDSSIPAVDVSMPYIFKGDFMNLYTDSILTSKSPVPSHIFVG